MDTIHLGSARIRQKPSQKEYYSFWYSKKFTDLYISSIERKKYFILKISLFFVVSV